MAESLVLDGLTIAPNVITTIVRLATEGVEGVDGLYEPSTLRRASSTRGIEIDTDADGALTVSLHIRAHEGYKLRDLGATVQKAVADALAVQIGVTVKTVDVFVDAVEFPE